MWQLLVLILLAGLVGCPSGGNGEASGSSSGGAPPSSSSATGGGSAPAGEDPGAKRRYAVESGVIEFELSGAESGKETLYFDRWGAREATWKQATIGVAGISRSSNTMSLTEGFDITNVDLDARTGTRVSGATLETMLKNSGAKDLLEMGASMLKRMGGTLLGTEEVAGRTCEIWEAAGTKSWIWNGLTLRVEAKLGPIATGKIATSVTEGAVPAEKLAIPDGVEVTAFGTPRKK